PSNLGLAVGPEIDYVKVKEHKTGRNLILAKARLSVYFKNPEEFTLVETFKGKALAGKHYEPLFSYFDTKKNPKAFQVIADDWVSVEDGTGLVHMAPAFGEADFFTCTREGIELVCPVDHNGKFTDEVPHFQGLYVKDADKGIIKYLKDKQKVFHHGQIRHRYPFCWRSDTPLIYKAVRTWFVGVEEFKEEIIRANLEIYWVPEHIKEGRFGKWLENARDWAISRNRYWGTPIPIWRSADGDIIVIGSVAELEKRTGKKIVDLHRHFIDGLTVEENGKTYHRIPEVFDCWIESGSMPYAQNHYPFENVQETMKTFPADFIAEGLDQTRGWFYTLNVLSAALFQKPAFKHVIVNGIVLAEDGAKMSKRLKNYPEPEKVMNEYGVDALRLFFLSSPAVIAEDMKFSEAGVELILRQVLIPFWNSFVFLSTYARIYTWSPASSFKKPHANIDRWILSLTQQLIARVTKAMDRYELNNAVEPFVKFIDQLTNWYIRRCRSRFWSEEESQDRREAFETLYTVLRQLIKVAAPFIPFLTEAIFLQLKRKEDPESVHLCDYPEYDAKLRDEALEEEMAIVQVVVNAGHALRKENKLKVRQPLEKAHLVTADERKLKALKAQKQLICDELNVKEIQFSSNEEEFVALAIKPNFRVLGKKVGPLMNQMQQRIAAFHQKQIATLLAGSPLEVKMEGQTITLAPEDVAIERKVHEGLIAKESEGITVVLDTTLTEALLMEGLAREIVNKINTMRRENGYAVTDRIHVKMDTTARAKKAFDLHKEYICHEVLALSVTFEKCEGTPWDLNGEPTLISIEAVF
ncbi:MAG TPA: isoleucine--tRNA ligase, partial [Rhabdochlamydiaceae bacterium]|nr:isoleucine--tRNA ligase [Rhabdochlamydiaceae bacterium]